MHYGHLKKVDIANGEGVRVTLFVSGCTNHCEGCFQPQTWNFKYGREYTADTEREILNALRPEYIKGLTLLGGEPMEIENQRELVKLVKRVRTELPDKDVWCYTGFVWEDLQEGGKRCCEVTDELLGNIDVLVDGRFMSDLKNVRLAYRGSENQRIIDVQATRAKKEIVQKEY